MNNKPIIALAQIKYFDTATTNNLKKIIRYIRLAKEKGADIICFPESCLYKSSLELDNKFVKQISEECKKNSIWCIITDDLKKDGKTYNTSLLIDRKGIIKGGYKKIHLYGDNTLAGNKSQVFKTDFGKVGIAICWDLAFPELFQKMKKRGAQIVFCPSQWWYDSGVHFENRKKREKEILRALVLARAYENVFFLALCNPVTGAMHQISYSAISSPVRILKEISGRQGLIVQKINLDEIKKIQKIYDS
ncbi:MAG: carbon-nitrogen hydrolase family protein [Candidatus Nanoarchaeia archaeon]